MPQTATSDVECIIPILRVRDLKTSLGFYTSKLGFGVDWQTTGMASVSRDRRAIMLCQGGQGSPGTWVWIGVGDVEALQSDLAAKGVAVRMPPTNFPWAYEMRVEDPDGHVLRLGSDRRDDRPVVAGDPD